MRQRPFAVAFFLALCASGALLSRVAAADEGRAMALDLFEHGRSLVKSGDYAAALTHFEAAARLMHTFGILLNIAECQEKVGRTASAWTTWKEALTVASEARNASDEAMAIQRQAALESALSRLTIAVPREADLSELAVRRDGVIVPREAWGRPIAVDPGWHKVEALALGHKTRSYDVFVRGDADKPSITISPLETDPAAGGAPPSAAESAAQPVLAAPLAVAAHATASPSRPVTPARDESTGGTSWQRVAGWILGGLGIAGVGAGIAIAVSGQGEHNDAVATDLAGHLSQAQSMEAQANTTKAIGYVTIGGGGAFLITGVFMALTAPTSSRATAVSVAPWVSSNGGGASFWRMW